MYFKSEILLRSPHAVQTFQVHCNYDLYSTMNYINASQTISFHCTATCRL